jgi:hypothetical protein
MEVVRLIWSSRTWQEAVFVGIPPPLALMRSILMAEMLHIADLHCAVDFVPFAVVHVVAGIRIVWLYTLYSLRPAFQTVT